MTRKYYNLLADSLVELKHSGVTSGTTLTKVCNKFVEILNHKMKQRFVNYNEAKFLKAVKK